MILNYVSHHTQSIAKNSLHKLLFDHVQSLETLCSDLVIQTYKSAVSTIELCYLAKLRKRKIKYTMQFFKV